MPRASMAEAMVLAVYIPPQAPAPGQLRRTIAARSSSEILPARYSPYDWKAEMMSSFLSLRQPGWIVPP